jgi:predicted kinase
MARHIEKPGRAGMVSGSGGSPGALYFLCGRAGAGKSTLARKISADRNAILFCEDQWLARLFGGASSLGEYVERRGRFRSLLTEHVPAILKAGHSVVLDFGGNTVRDRAACVRSAVNQCDGA